MYDVIRNFGLDYIYFDLIFLAVFLGSLIIYKKKVPLITFLIGGLGINFLVDWGIWLHAGIREISLPVESFGTILLFFIWFSLSYGVEYAYVFLMFEEKASKLTWTLFVLVGWLLVAFLSQWVALNDDPITVVRHMSELRLLRIVIVIIGYGLLFLFKYDWKKILFLFFIGFLIHFMMEFTLLISGIRPGSLLILLENSLIEFNMGVPFFYLLYDKYLRKRFLIANHG
jgi:hypothetical protein